MVTLKDLGPGSRVIRCFNEMTPAALRRPAGRARESGKVRVCHRGGSGEPDTWMCQWMGCGVWGKEDTRKPMREKAISRTYF